MRRIDVRPRASGWVVRVESADGGSFQFACASERQARYFAAVYRLQRACLKLERRAQEAGATGVRAAPRMRA